MTYDKNYAKAYRERTKQRRADYQLEWRNRNPDYNVRYNAEHRSDRKEIDRRHREKNPQKYREKIKKYQYELRMELITLLGGRCSVCHTIEDLEIDHKRGSGIIDRLRYGNSNYSMYRFYIKNSELAKEKLQVLCWFHNNEKRKLMHENGKTYSQRIRE